MSELLGKAGGLGKYSEIWRGAETQPGGEFRHSSDPNCTFCCYKRFFLICPVPQIQPRVALFCMMQLKSIIGKPEM